MKSHPESQRDAHFKEMLDQILPELDCIMSYGKPYTQLGHFYKGGITGYYSKNLSEDELKIANEMLKDTDQ